MKNNKLKNKSVILLILAIFGLLCFIGGIPTIIIAALPPVVRQTGTPRAVAPLVPMGANAGGPHNVEQQTAIVKATLEQLVEIQTPGKIVPLPFEYVAKI